MTFRELIHKCPYKRVFNALHKRYYYGNPKETIEKADLGYLGVYKALEQMPLNQNADWEIHVLEKIDDPDGDYMDTCYHNIEEDETYAIDLTAWSELIDCEVKKLADISDIECVGHILWEITFYGFSEDKVKAVKDEMDELRRRIDSGEEKLIPFDLSELDIEE